MKKSLVTSLALMALVASHLGTAAQANVSEQSKETILKFLGGKTEIAAANVQTFADSETINGNSDTSTLDFFAESISPSGIRTVRVQQMVGGQKVFGTETRFTLNSDSDTILNISHGQLNAVAQDEETTMFDSSAAFSFMKQDYNSLAASAINALDLDWHSQEQAPSVQEGWYSLADGSLVPATYMVLWTTPLAYEVIINSVTGELLNSVCITTVCDFGETTIPTTLEAADPMKTVFDVALPKMSFGFDSFNVIGGEELFEDAEEPASSNSTGSPMGTIENAYFDVLVTDIDGKTPLNGPAPSVPSQWQKQSNSSFPGWHPKGAARTVVAMDHAINWNASPIGWLEPRDPSLPTIDEIIAQDISGDFTKFAGWTTYGNNANVFRGRTSARYALSGDLALDYNIGRPVATDRKFILDPEVYPSPGKPSIQNDPNWSPMSGDSAFHVEELHRAAVVNAFYMANYYHDMLYSYGFDEAAGNFQTRNFGRGGVENDAVRVRIQYGATTTSTTNINNSSFSTPRDGSPGTMQAYLFTGPLVAQYNPDNLWLTIAGSYVYPERPWRDCGFEGEVFGHELGHGTNHRMATAPPADEGYADLSGLMVFNADPDTDEDGIYPYCSYGFFMRPFNRRPPELRDTLENQNLVHGYYYGVRRFPYSSQFKNNPHIAADLDDTTMIDYDVTVKDPATGIANWELAGMVMPGNPSYVDRRMANQTHNAGTVFSNTVWHARANIIKQRVAEGITDRTTANRIMLLMMVDALRLIPDYSNQLQNRDAFILADRQRTNDPENPATRYEESLWKAFAARGYGFDMIMTPGGPIPSGANPRNGNGMRTPVTASFEMPYIHIADAAKDVKVFDSANGGNNNGAIDFGETVELQVKLTNPWHNSSKTAKNVKATISTENNNIKIIESEISFGDIAPNSSSIGHGAFKITAPIDVHTSAGAPLDFTITVTHDNELYTTDLLEGPNKSWRNTTVYTPDQASFPMKLRVGKKVEGKLGTPIEYKSTNQVAIAESPDLRGSWDTITIEDDYDIADLKLRVDDFQAPKGVGVYTMSYKSAAGFGGNLKAGSSSGTSTVKSMSNVTFSDTGSSLPSATSASAQWDNGNFISYVRAGYSFGDHVGKSSKGDWTLLAAESNENTPIISLGEGLHATLKGWTVIVTPAVYEVEPLPTADLTSQIGFDNNAGAGTMTATPITTETQNSIAADLRTELGMSADEKLTFITNPAHIGKGAPTIINANEKGNETLKTKLVNAVADVAGSNANIVFVGNNDEGAKTSSFEISCQPGAILQLSKTITYEGNLNSLKNAYFVYDYIDEGTETKTPALLIGPDALITLDDAVRHDIVELDETTNTLTINYFVMDYAGDPVIADNKLVITDGNKNGVLADPIYLLNTDGKTHSGGGDSSSDCNTAGFSLGALALAIFPFLRRKN